LNTEAYNLPQNHLEYTMWMKVMVYSFISITSEYCAVCLTKHNIIIPPANAPTGPHTIVYGAQTSSSSVHLNYADCN